MIFRKLSVTSKIEAANLSRKWLGEISCYHMAGLREKQAIVGIF